MSRRGAPNDLCELYGKEQMYRYEKGVESRENLLLHRYHAPHCVTPSRRIARARVGNLRADFFWSAHRARRRAKMTKYILVSGGVVSGIGKGVIGTLLPVASLRSCSSTRCSLLDRLAAQDDRPQGHRNQDRPIHEHRCGYHAAPGAW